MRGAYTGVIGLLGWALLAVGAVLAGASPALAQDRYALVIGVDRYERAPDLRNPSNDARDLGARLSQLGYTLIGGGAQIDVTREQMIDRLDELSRRVRPGDTVFVFFAGHGSFMGEGDSAETYLIPSNDRSLQYREDLPERALGLMAIQRRLLGAQVTGVIVIDACRDLPLPSRMGGRSLGRGLAPPRARAANGLLIAYAADVGQVASDGAGRNSPFTTALLEALDGSIARMDDIFYSVRRRVRELTNGAQDPLVQAYLDAPLFLTAASITTAASADIAPVQTRPGETPEAARLRSACEGGNAASCRNLGVMYANGRGVTRDDARAVALYRQACEGGEAGGCSNLGFMYENGRGVTQDQARAVALYRQACEGGNAISCGNLGLMYANGRGVTRDDARAVSLYRQACEGGNAAGCRNLGNRYRDGNGVTRNVSEARRYLRLGCDGGDQQACTNLDNLPQ